MDQNEGITKAAEIIQLLYMWGVNRGTALVMAKAMLEMIKETGPEEWNKNILRYIDPKTGGKVMQ